MRNPRQFEREYAFSLVRQNGLASCVQISLALLEGISEAVILTIIARMAVESVVNQVDIFSVPVLGSVSQSSALLYLFAVVVIRLLTGVSRVVVSNRLERNIRVQLRSDIIFAHSNAAVGLSSRLDSGEIQQLMVTLPNSVAGQLSTLILNLGQVFMMFAMLAISFFNNPLLTLGLLGAILLSSLGFRPLRRRIKSRANSQVGSQQELALVASETGTLTTEAEAFGVRERFRDRILDSVIQEAAIAEKVGRLKGSIFPLYISVTYGAVALGLVVLIEGSSSTLTTTGPTLLIVLRALAYGQSVQQALGGIASIVPALSHLVRARLDFEASSRHRGHLSLSGQMKFRFESVTFRYGGSERNVLSDVSLDVPSGGRLGVLGPSGGGKSTLVKVLLGLEEPSSGQVLLNDRSLYEFSADSLGSSVGFVPQEAKFFSGSVRANLEFLREGITDSDLLWALEVADARHFVEGLSEGVETIIGPGGVGLSVGQGQRLAIARAFVHRPKFVVMDEPTASLDAASENSVSQAIEQLPRDTALLIVSHRKRILESCDWLIVVESGRIVAAGATEDVRTSIVYSRALGA